jgi:hypothetical protein
MVSWGGLCRRASVTVARLVAAELSARPRVIVVTASVVPSVVAGVVIIRSRCGHIRGRRRITLVRCGIRTGRALMTTVGLSWIRTAHWSRRRLLAIVVKADSNWWSHHLALVPTSIVVASATAVSATETGLAVGLSVASPLLRGRSRLGCRRRVGSAVVRLRRGIRWLSGVRLRLRLRVVQLGSVVRVVVRGRQRIMGRRRLGMLRGMLGVPGLRGLLRRRVGCLRRMRARIGGGVLLSVRSRRLGVSVGRGRLVISATIGASSTTSTVTASMGTLLVRLVVVLSITGLAICRSGRRRGRRRRPVVVRHGLQ